MQGFTSIPLTIRVPLFVALLMVILGAIASQLVMSGLARVQERQLQELAQGQLESLSVALAPLAIRQDVWEMFDILDRTMHRTTGLRARRTTLVDTRGHVLVSSDPENAPVGSPGIALVESAQPVENLDFSGAEDILTVRAELEHQGQQLGNIVIVFDASDLVVERRTAALFLLLGNAAATFLLALAGYAIVHRMLKPVSALSQRMIKQSDDLQPFPEEMIPAGDNELSRLYRSFNSMVDAVARRNEAERRLLERERFVSLGRLAGSLAHEINNPLGGLLNAVDTIRRYPDRPDAVASSADLLDRGLKHMRDVVGATLDSHRAKRQSDPLSSVDFDDLRLLLLPEINRQEQSLSWEIEASTEKLARYPGASVRQIALNLLLNASTAAGPKGEIGLRVDADDRALSLFVSDDGPGLSEQAKARLLSDAALAPGGGVGLRLVRNLVQELGGRIELGSDSRTMTEVVVRLPVRTPPTAAHSTEPEFEATQC